MVFVGSGVCVSLRVQRKVAATSSAPSPLLGRWQDQDCWLDSGLVDIEKRGMGLGMGIGDSTENND